MPWQGRLKYLFLFDIDGTLISSGGVSRGLLSRAINYETSHDIELGYNDVAGFTDLSITRNVLSNLNIDGLTSSKLLDTILERYLVYVKSEFNQSTKPFVYDDCITFLNMVEGAGHSICLFTGNMKTVAKIKLGRFGIWDRFPFGVFSDDGEDKNSMLRLAQERAWDILQESFRMEKMVVVGDTVQDAEAAKNNGCKSIIVCRVAEKKGAIEKIGPDILVDDLSCPDLLNRLYD